MIRLPWSICAGTGLDHRCVGCGIVLRPAARLWIRISISSIWAEDLAGEIDTVYAAYNRQQVNFDEGFDSWDGYALTLRFVNGAVGNCAGTYGLFPEIQLGPVADFALRDRLVRLTTDGVTHYTPEGIQTWQNREPFHLGVNRAFVNAVRGQ